MGSGRYVISQWWQDHHKKVLAVAVLAWVVFITLAYQRLSARSNEGATSAQGTVVKMLPVGGLPVTWNLTLPIACQAMNHSLTKGTNLDGPMAGGLAEYSKFSGWPELKEALMAGKIKAAYMLAPMVMDLADKGVPVKIVGLGHRSGAVIMVKTDSPYKTFADLKGKRVAIPSRFAVDHIFVRKIMKQYGMTTRDLEMVEMPPPDMPAALYAGAVDAYATGEPFGAVSQKAGYGRPLYMTRDYWPNYLCCVLTVRDELIQTDRPMVQKLVNHIMAAGLWLDASPAHRTQAVEIAAGPNFFNQDPEVLKFVMRNPPDRVTYGDLRMIRQEFEELVQFSLDAGILSRPVPYEKFVDESFVRNLRSVEIALDAR